MFLVSCGWFVANDVFPPFMLLWLVLRLRQPNKQEFDVDLDVLELDSRENAAPSLDEAKKAAEPEPEEYREQVCPLTRVAAFLPELGDINHTLFLDTYQASAVF